MSKKLKIAKKAQVEQQVEETVIEAGQTEHETSAPAESLGTELAMEQADLTEDDTQSDEIEQPQPEVVIAAAPASNKALVTARAPFHSESKAYLGVLVNGTPTWFGRGEKGVVAFEVEEPEMTEDEETGEIVEVGPKMVKFVAPRGLFARRKMLDLVVD